MRSTYANLLSTWLYRPLLKEKKMDPITAAAAISAGTALVGGILGNQANASNTAAANAQAAANTASANRANCR